jgi:hypothetical protein
MEIVGRVTNLAGEPVADAVVMIGDLSPDHPDIGALTNHDGSYKLNVSLPGSYTVIVSAPGYEQQPRQVLVPANEGARLDFRLDR